jgi:hypothetical protein
LSDKGGVLLNLGRLFRAQIVGFDCMIFALEKLLILEKKEESLDDFLVFTRTRRREATILLLGRFFC